MTYTLLTYTILFSNKLITYKINADHLLSLVQNFDLNYASALTIFNLIQPIFMHNLGCLYLACCFLFKQNLLILMMFKKSLPVGVLSNGISSIHPMFIVSLNMAIMLSLTIFYRSFYFTKFNYLTHLNFNLHVLITALALYTGAYWSYQEVGWGGWWSWDLIEILLLINFLIFSVSVHISNTHLKQFKTLTLSVFSILFFTFLVKYNIINSIHNFIIGNNNLEVVNYYITTLISTIFVYLVIFKKINSKVVRLNIIGLNLNFVLSLLFTYVLLSLFLVFWFKSTSIYFTTFFASLVFIVTFLIITLQLFNNNLSNLKLLLFNISFLEFIFSSIFLRIFNNFKNKKHIIYYIYVITFFFNIKKIFFTIKKKTLIFKLVKVNFWVMSKSKVYIIFFKGNLVLFTKNYYLFSKMCFYLEDKFSKFYLFICINVNNLNFKIYGVSIFEMIAINYNYILVTLPILSIYWVFYKIKPKINI